MVLRVRTRMEHVRYWRRVPRVPTPVGFHAVPLVRPLVTAFRLVREVTRRAHLRGCERKGMFARAINFPPLQKR